MYTTHELLVLTYILLGVAICMFLGIMYYAILVKKLYLELGVALGALIVVFILCYLLITNNI